ncbi:Uncharacterized protein GBIM_00022, partial [Gryllus bimaculatus]
MKDNRSMFSKMNFLQPSSRRVAVLQRIFSKTYLVTPNEISRSFGVFGTKYAGEKLVKIGDISKVVKPAKNPQYVPLKYVEGESSQEILRHLRWMLQKDLLGQDMFLIGRPGPLRRLLAMQYLEITDRELEYVSLSRDTTEADLKQRREIKNGTAVYFDQSAVRAAVEGRILILEGIEKAERNVLPVLNNLLENREMHLEDGRFLMPAKRYDQLLKEHSQEELDCWKLVRVSENFRVIALGIPVPRYVGNPLDPPLRSRFQARDISGLTYKEQLEALRALVPGLEGARLSQLLSCAHALLTADAAALGLADFPADGLPAAARILENTPSLPDYDALYRLYPYKSFLSAEGQAAVENVLSTFQVLPRHSKSVSMNINNVIPKNGTAEVEITVERKSSVLQVPCGSLRENVVTNDFVPNVYQEKLLADLMLSHQFKDICVIGPRGCGKSATVSEFAKRLNYVVEPIVLYQDMTSRDLLQQRSTLLNGDTIWQNSPLVTAALEGKLAVLDGIHRIHPSTLAVVHRLVHDRELTLHDGSRLLRHDRYDDIKSSQNLTDNQLEEYGIFKIHPSFRIIALAEPPVQGSSLTQWLSPEMLSLFLYHEMRPLKPDEEMHLVKNLLGSANKAFEHVMRVAHRMRESDDPAVRALSSSLSTRQLLRIAKRMRAYPGDSPANAIYRACLARFLPALPRQALDKILLDEDLPLINAETSSPTCKVEGEKVTIGNTTVPRYKTDAKTKIPDIQFYDVPQHITALEWLLQDFFLGEHLLLIGNQGVGKNKLADRLLQLLNRPREYIQLHRDTTVQTLTLQPTVRDGVVVYEDSPLVQAVKLGHVLIVDEADKAPTHVTCILKTLVESGEMILSDGRRIVPLNHPQTPTNKGIIPIHPDFRMIVLANRPGFPFLGNDFFGALGDLFSCHAVDNPSAQSEHALLKQYGPDVPDEIIARLVRAFGELRNMADQGLVQYPYSTREVVNIVKHLQEFPNESLVNVVGNVFDFDTYSQEVQDTLTEVLQKNGIPLHVHTNKINLAKEFPLPPLQQAGEWKVTHPSPPTILPVEERFLRTKTPITLRKYQHPLDLTEARGSVFSEMQSYWVVPVGETGIVAGLAVSKSFENDPLKDWIHVMATNPMKLFSMQSSGKDIHELSLQGLLHPVRGSRPRFKMCPIKTDDSSILLIHEESSNGLVLVDPFAGYARPVAQTSFIEDTTATLASAFPFNVKDKNWKMLTDLVEDKKFIVLFEDNGQRIDAINVETMTAYSMTLPVNLKTLNLPSIDRWLVEDTESRKYLLAKADPSEPIPRVSQAEKDAVPEHVKKAAHEMAQKAFKQRLREIQMSEYDASVYQQYLGSVAAQVQALRVILGSLQAKSKERQWQRHQTTGELDDAKLIEGLTGEKTIYRRRFEKEPELGTPQTKPKRLKFIVDVSGSMYRFNGYDGRLDREMEAVIMVMEAFQGFEAQIQYDIMGHSGEDYNLQFVDHRKPPADNKQRLDIIKIMHAHSQFCLSGDHTLEATKFGISQLSKEDCDEAIVVVLSDANLRRYGIAPESFAKILTSESNVSAYAIFIGSLGDEAVRLTKQMPAGRAFVCLDLTKLPQILQQIFSASVLSTRLFIFCNLSTHFAVFVNNMLLNIFGVLYFNDS